MGCCRYLLIGCTFVFSWSVQAINEPLNIGTENYSPPFVMRASTKNLTGYDIDMMRHICKTLQRNCKYHVMKFRELLPAVQAGKIDIAISSITITLERAKRVAFSLPYLVSYSRFLTKKTAQMPAFSFDALHNKKIGVEQGTVFKSFFAASGIKATVKEYEGTNTLLEALGAGAVDYIILDNPTAVYWQANALTNVLVTVGKPFIFGDGLGIAVNPRDRNLLLSINAAILEYQNSAAFKTDYNNYFQL